MFDQVGKEIDERRAFLGGLKSSCKPSEYAALANQTSRDIQERVKELSRIDRLLKECS